MLSKPITLAVHSSSGVYAAHNDWFWPNSKNGSPDCICGGATCKWETDPERCWFTDYLPHWNYTNQAARGRSCVGCHWASVERAWANAP